MMKNLLITLGMAFLLVLPSCKPTEKGYKSAYDLAKGKREAVAADLGINLPEGALQEVDGAQLREVDGVKVYVSNQRLVPVQEGMSQAGAYNVAVGKYKMSTNGVAQANALKNEGFEAFAAKDSEGMYYTVAGSFPTLSEAVSFYQRYQQGKDRVYVGLPSAPVIIYSPK